MFALFRVPAFLLACVLCGCTQTQLEHQSDAVNRASAVTLGEHTLLNAVRASLDLPMSFTKLQKFTSENMAKGSLTPKFPFGADAARIFDLGPSLSWSSGVSSIEYVDANTAGALAKLNQTLPYDAIDRYTTEAVPYILSLNVFVANFEVHELLVNALKAQFQNRCRPANSLTKAVCDKLDGIASPNVCRKHWFDERLVQLDGKQKFLLVLNDATDRCGYLRVQSLLLNLGLADFGAEARADEVFDTVLTPEQKRVPVAKTKTSVAVRFQEPHIQKIFEELERKLKPYKGRAPLQLSLRSSRGVLTYLGQLIALQNFAKEKHLPKTMVGTLPITVFRVLRGAPDAAGAAVAVRGPDGDTYFVPRVDHAAEERDYTLRVLSMAAEVVNSAISDKDLPAPASIVVRAIQ